jgi:hypothetical protein
MWPVEHLAVQIDDAGRRRGREGIDHSARRRDGRFGRRKHLVNDGHLSRMDRHLSGEAVPAGFLAFAAQTLEIAKRRKNRVDRFDAGGDGSEQAEPSRNGSV